MLREKLIAAGVNNLRTFGYPSVTAENIISDPLFREFFRSMLEDNLGKGADEAVRALIDECDDATTLADPS